jgi:hypothetical protein
MPSPSSPARPAPSAQAEAARYALLRRLAPSMRHHLVVNLQPIGMIYEVMDRRLRAPVPDLAHVQDSAGKINGFAKAALNSCIDVVSWLAPDDSAATTVPDAVRECTALLATSLSFRGYALRNEAGEVPGRVGRSGVRALLSAALLYWTDHAQPPADLAVTASAQADGAVVAVEVRPTQGAPAFPGEANYRPLERADLEALAAADGVQVRLEGQRIELRLPWIAA